MKYYLNKHLFTVLLLCLFVAGLFGQKPFFASDQRIFSNGAFSDINGAFIGLTDKTNVGIEGSTDWSGFEGNPQTGLFYSNTRVGTTGSFAGFGLKFDKIAAFKRTQINATYAYSATLSDNNGFKPLRLIIGMQPQIDFFRANYVDAFSELYPTAVPIEGLDQSTFGFNTGLLLTNAGFEDAKENTWFAGASSRMTGLKLSKQEEGVTDIRHRELIIMGGIRQNVNFEDLYLDATGYLTSSEAGIDLALFLNLEKHNPVEIGTGGGWIGVGFKTNTQSLVGAKQLIIQAGLIRALFEGENKLLKIGVFAETDLGPFALLGNRFGLLAVYQK